MKSVTKIDTLLLILVLAGTTLCSTTNKRMLAMFNTTPDGYRFPKWLQIATFAILCLIIVGSIVAIILFSKNAAGPPRVDHMMMGGGMGAMGGMNGMGGGMGMNGMGGMGGGMGMGGMGGGMPQRNFEMSRMSPGRGGNSPMRGGRMNGGMSPRGSGRMRY